MHSLASVSSEPADDLDVPVAARLRRLCQLLRVDGARLSNLLPGRPALVARAGIETPLAALEQRAAAAPGPLVIADTGQREARFYAGIGLPAEAEHPAQLLSLFDARPRSPAMATAIAALASEVLAWAVVKRQRRQIAVQQAAIADSAAMEQQRRSLFDRASATARIGIWQCNLGDSSLTWTNGVYDLFEIPRNTVVTREMSLACYTEASRRQMEAARAAAIANCSDFALDIEIITTRGRHRWVRLTGAVESRDGVATRIFGMKQDITEEKLLADRTRYLAEFDVMTGLANRSLFQHRLAEMDEQKGDVGALLLVDVDGFKQINDTHGHAIGDECLKVVAERLAETCGDARLVARIGGDEFAIMLASGVGVAEAESLAETVVQAMRRPVVRQGQKIQVGVSIGIAHHRSGSSQELFRDADTALYAAKAAGRGTSRTVTA
ncbi:MAG TPA: GGDEF domain-containing protein [Devosia sp.]|nr:GGDEF domain-containing protein [Devosia sp.]